MNKQAHAPVPVDAPNDDMLLEMPDVNLAKFTPDHIDVRETEFIQTNAQVSFSPNSCWAGIDRWDSSTNSQSTYDKAVSSGQLWEDPEFGPDDTSITWADFGFGEMSHPIKRGMPWKRPSEMAYGWPSKPSLFGEFGVPLPQGVK